MMVKLCAVPVQPAAAGVTVIVAVAVAVPVFTAVKDAILPVPADASPMVWRLLAQE